MAGLSDLVGNVPATMLALPHLDHSRPTELGMALALGNGFSSNLLISGSLAGIFAAQLCAGKGHRLTLAEFTRAGLPVTLLSLLIGFVWVLRFA